MNFKRIFGFVFIVWILTQLFSNNEPKKNFHNLINNSQKFVQRSFSRFKTIKMDNEPTKPPTPIQGWDN